MQSRWSDAEAQSYVERYADSCPPDLALRVYTSRLIGRDPSLVLHGGGNTSVKTRLRDDTGKELDVLCVKGSGWDLGDIEPAGLPALRQASLLELRALPALSDEAMVNAQRIRMLDASAPNPSVETLLHAFLPHKFIDHSHADAILALVDQPDSEALCRRLFGDRFGIVPYIMPGFALAKLAAETFEQNPQVEGLLLLKHGLFTFGETARQSYERHIAAVSVAEEFARSRGARIEAVSPGEWHRSDRSCEAMAGEVAQHSAQLAAREVSRELNVAAEKTEGQATPSARYVKLAPVLRGLLGEHQRRYALQLRTSPQIQRFIARPDLATVSQVGCGTPDHVIRTKRFPLVLELHPERTERDQADSIRSQLRAYREQYRAYVTRQSARKTERIVPLDPDPRVILVEGVGLIAAGPSAAAAGIAADIYEHTIDVIEQAQRIGRYEALPESDIFDMEYWSLEQKKLGAAKARALEGRVVYISGAAHGIGAACARRFANAGAALYLVDRDAQRLAELAQQLRAAHEVLDLRDENALRSSVARCVAHFGGLDGVVSNAGVAPQSAIAACKTQDLEQSFRINFFAHQWLAAAAVDVMHDQGMGGFLLFNASKAAWNPGPEFGPYAVPKAALVALMKQYALEYGSLGIRANAVNADRIRTHLLDEADIAARARSRGLEPDAYYRANLLGREVTAEDVADAFVYLATAPSTTGSVVTVDGGNIAASPR
ncbi:MAG TPA: bifunctional aldolase/short-chain dehydrogenase [Polyangiales bacterium]|nr:bifunctional aldolase/short-chain dehydrogenase [Polyangiales bacterium]